MIGIYLIRNKVNGKCYVGQAMDIEKRWKQHIRKSKKPKFPIHFAIEKYGVDNFEFSVLEECSANELDAREIEWIAKLDTYNNGYNCTLGGDGHNLGKNCYSKEYQKSWREEHKDDPEFKMRHRSSSNERYYKLKDDPEFKRKKNAQSKAYYEAHKDDPEFNEKRKAYRESKKKKVSDETDSPLF